MVITCRSCGTRSNKKPSFTKRKNFTGLCKLCWNRISVDKINSIESIKRRKSGPASHFYKRGFTVNDSGYKITSLPLTHRFRCMTDRHGRIREHRLVMANIVGRPLESWEVVHHKNGDKQDNRPENLELLSCHTHTLVTKMEQEIASLQEEVKRLRCLQKFAA